uniref:Uncharacterized protein n=1 Tax=Myotis myotis TaxID=51298 RepID=A0A7J8AMB0_MYOMY|nr:hypothetical protein mMyoMyo1_008136 [Myotis myotis]
MPTPVTLRVGLIGGLGHRPLSHSRQGRWGGCGAAPCHTQSRAYQGRWGSIPCHTQSRADQGVGELPHVTHRAGPIRGLEHSPRHTQGRADGEVVVPPCHTQSRAHGGVGAPSPVTNRAVRIGRLWPRPLSHTEPQGDQEIWALPPVTLLQGPGGLAAPLDTGEVRPCCSADPRPGGLTALLIPGSGGLVALLIPVQGGILPCYYIG